MNTRGHTHVETHICVHTYTCTPAFKHTHIHTITHTHRLSHRHTLTQTHACTPLDPEGIKCNNPHATLYVVAGDTGSQGNRSLWEQGNTMGKADAYGEHYTVIKGKEQE